MSGESSTAIANKTYMESTGNCPKCHLPIDGHAQCESCLILCGPEHECEIVNFRECEICNKCVAEWLRLEDTLGREVAWGEFLKPTPAMSKSTPWR